MLVVINHIKTKHASPSLMIHTPPILLDSLSLLLLTIILE